jgi:hypothetical protein
MTREQEQAKLGSVISVRLSDEVYVSIKRIAQQKGISPGAVVRQCIEDVRPMSTEPEPSSSQVHRLLSRAVVLERNVELIAHVIQVLPLAKDMRSVQSCLEQLVDINAFLRAIVRYAD